MGKHLSIHGDGVKDIAFEVEDCFGLYKVCADVYIAQCILTRRSMLQI